MKEDYQKAFKKSTLFLLSNPVPFNGQSYQKQKGPGTSDQPLFTLENMFIKIPFLFIYYFFNYSKNYMKHVQIYATQFMTS